MMRMEDLFLTVERDKSLGRIDRKSSIEHVNDALLEINKATSKSYEEIVEDFDEQFIELSYIPIKINEVSIGSDDNFTTLNKMRHASRAVKQFEE